MNKENIFGRIRKIIEYKGISNNEFGRNIKCSSTQVTQMLTHERNFGIDKLLKILSSYPEISPDWLLLGQGDMLREKRIQELPSPQNDILVDKLLIRIENQSEEINRLKEENRSIKEKIK